MIWVILGFRSSEYVDEIVLVLLSTFTLGQPPAIKYDYASFIAHKIHAQFMNLERGVFKYTIFIYHLLLYYHPDSFLFPIRKLDSKRERRSVIFWISIFNKVGESPYTYCEFIDGFVHPASTLLIWAPPPKPSSDIHNILQLSQNYKIGDWYFY